MGFIRHIFVAPQRGAPMRSLDSVQALTDSGLEGNRYANLKHRKSLDYQLTLIDLVHIEAFATTSNLPFTPDQPRRNLVTAPFATAAGHDALRSSTAQAPNAASPFDAGGRIRKV